MHLFEVQPAKSHEQHLRATWWAPAIEAGVDDFYRRVLKDEELRPYFDDIDMDRQRAKQGAFLTMVTGGPNEYTGRDMRTAHARLVERGIGNRHVDRVIKHLGDTLAGLGVADELTIVETRAPPEAWTAFVCGDPKVVKALRFGLFLAGVSSKRIFADAFVMTAPPGESSSAA